MARGRAGCQGERCGGDQQRVPTLASTCEYAVALLVPAADWRLAMQAEAHLGLRDTVSQRYEALCDLLDERLGLEPSRETRTLHRRLLSQA